MPVDSGLYNTPVVNPLEQANQANSLIGGIQSNQMQGMSNQLMRGKLALGQVVKNNTDENGQTDWNKAIGEAASNPITAPVANLLMPLRDQAQHQVSYPNAAGTPQYRTLQQRQQELTGTPPNSSQVPQDQLDNIHERVDAYDNALAPLANSEAPTKADAKDAIVGLVADGHMTPNDAVSTLTKLPDDPKQLKEYLGQEHQQLMNAKAQITQRLGPHSSAIRKPVDIEGPSLSLPMQVEGSVKAYNDLNTNDAGYANRSFALKQAITALGNAQTGKGTEGLNSIKSVLLSLAPEELKKLNLTPDEIRVADRDKANKYLTQYASLFPGAGRSDAGLMTSLTGNASTNINNLAARDVARYALGMERMTHDQLIEFNKSGKDSSDYNKWKTGYLTSADPTAFAADLFSPEELKRSIPKKGTQAWEKWSNNYERAIKNGLVEHKYAK